MQDYKNFFLVVALCALTLFVGDYVVNKWFVAPQSTDEEISQQNSGPVSQDSTLSQRGEESVPESPGKTVAIHTPDLEGSFDCKGLRLNHLVLKNYRETQQKDSPPVTLLAPESKENAYTVTWGFTSSQDIELPTPKTHWAPEGGEALTDKTPLVFRWVNKEGVVFSHTFRLVGTYLFDVSSSVYNPLTRPVSLALQGKVQRRAPQNLESNMLVFEGPLGYLEGSLQEYAYAKLQDKRLISSKLTDGWLGITDKYWLVAFAPEGSLSSFFMWRKTHFMDTSVVYETPRVQIPAGETHTFTSRLFTGAKILNLLDAYEKTYDIPHFDLAVDFGWFYFITKPVFYVLTYLKDFSGSFWMAILLFTVLLKLLFFPLANRSYRSMANMRKLQPMIEDIKTRYKGEPQELSKQMMALYKREKINPISGCLPMVLQIPFFFALYKVLTISIGMRHAGFPGWIADLSVPDPTNLFTLFGLIPWHPPAFLHLGAWPLLMGFSMYLQQRLSPPPTDPTQRVMFTYAMPLIFTYIMANFAAGVIIFWTWSNLLSTLQQWLITRLYEKQTAPQQKR